MAHRKDILLKEYEICQQDSSSNASLHWTVVGIFMGINTALFGGIAYSILTGNTFFDGNVKWLVLTLALMVTAIVIFLWFWLDRLNFLIYVNHYRMRQIEVELRMQKNRIVDFLDNYRNDLSCEQRKRFSDLLKRYSPRQTKLRGVKWIYCILILPWWVLFIVLIFVLDC